MSIYTPQQEFPRNELPRLLEREAGYYAALELCELVLRGEMDPTDEERVQAEEMKLDLLQRIAKVRGEISSKTPTPPASTPDLEPVKTRLEALETQLTEVRDRISQLGNIPTQPPQSPSPTSSAPTSQELRRLYELINSLTDEINKLKQNTRLTPLSNLGRILKALEGREVRLTDEVEEMLRKIITPHQDTETSAPEPTTPQPSDNPPDHVKKQEHQIKKASHRFEDTREELQAFQKKDYSSESQTIEKSFKAEKEKLLNFQNEIGQMLQKMRELRPYNLDEIENLRREITVFIRHLPDDRPEKIQDHSEVLFSFASDMIEGIQIMYSIQKSGSFEEAELKFILDDINRVYVIYLTLVMVGIEMLFGETTETKKHREYLTDYFGDLLMHNYGSNEVHEASSKTD